MKKTKLLYAFGLIGLLALASCGEDESPITVDCNAVTYAGTIKPLVAANCSSSNCHGGGSVNGDWTTYAGIETVAKNGVMNTRVVVDKDMPLNGSLSEEEIAQVKCWLDDGAPNN